MRYASLKERLEICSIPIPECGCLIFTGPITKNGYGLVSIGKTARIYAHRLAWTLVNGPIPNGLWILHRCDIRCCINLDHLFMGTRADNIADAVKKRRTYRAFGTKSPFAILSEEQVLAIRCSLGTHRKIAKQFGVGHSTVGAIKRRETWNHLP